MIRLAFDSSSNARSRHDSISFIASVVGSVVGPGNANGPRRDACRPAGTPGRRGRLGRANDSGLHRRLKAPVSVGPDSLAGRAGASRIRVPGEPWVAGSKARAPARAAGPVAAVLVGVLLTGAATVVHAVSGEAISPPGRFVGIGSHRLHIHCTGTGTPSVVFESGLGGTLLDWVRVQPEVARFTRACSYDRAGYGWSELGPEPRHADRIASELDRLLLNAGVPAPYVLVGHSFGGLAIRLFAARKERGPVAGLVLVDATHEHQFRRMESAGVRVPMAPTGRRFVIANHGMVPDGLPERLKPLAQRLASARKSIRTLYGELGSLRHSARQVGAIRRSPGAPIIVLARGPRPDADADADHDRRDRVWHDLQRELAGTMKDGSFQVVRGSGHYIHLERPERVIDAIRTIVDAYRRGRASESALRRGTATE